MQGFLTPQKCAWLEMRCSAVLSSLIICCTNCQVRRVGKRFGFLIGTKIIEFPPPSLCVSFSLLLMLHPFSSLASLGELGTCFMYTKFIHDEVGGVERLWCCRLEWWKEGESVRWTKMEGRWERGKEGEASQIQQQKRGSGEHHRKRRDET